MMTLLKGLVQRQDGSKEIVLSTGFDFGVDTSTEILDLEDLVWRPGPEFPTTARVYGGASLQYKNSFLAIGGQSIGSDDDVRVIWYYDPDTDDWVNMDVVLSEERFNSGAVLMPDGDCS